MATERQIEANRRNALQSTGPRTDEGKAASSRNAVWHGLSAHRMLLDGEDPQHFHDLRVSLYEELRPSTEVEAQLVESLAQLYWRLARAPAFEAAIVNFTVQVQRRTLDPSPWEQSRGGRTKGACEVEPDDHPKLWGRAVKDLFKFDLMSRLSRHETQLKRDAERTLDRLRALQKERGEPCQKPLEQGDTPADITITTGSEASTAIVSLALKLVEQWAKSKVQLSPNDGVT